ncbi:MAG: hypothetical protein GY940_06775 [bacterium]|nr:hypothetical protein [bacterium]
MILTKDDKPQCYVIRGRQIVTRENLEVLAVGTARTIPDGLPIETVIEKLVENEEPAVLAWGVGKWFFKRGKIIKKMMDRYRSPYLMIGDNSGRPTFWPTPRLFKKAAAMGIPDINGSDPLPFEDDFAKVGSFGFTVEGDFNKEKPNQSLKELLITPGIDSRIDRFGFRDPFMNFFKRQSKIYIKKYLKKK